MQQPITKGKKDEPIVGSVIINDITQQENIIKALKAVGDFIALIGPTMDHNRRVAAEKAITAIREL